MGREVEASYVYHTDVAGRGSRHFMINRAVTFKLVFILRHQYTHFENTFISSCHHLNA